ncbi:MAG: hypothetical protein HC904_14730 [Blastochloris sp.]|nr:hypothetical protein [Blastochloris sp.]
MDISDFIIPLIIVGGAIAQWVGSRKQGGEPSSPTMPEPFPFDEPRPRKSTQEQELDDLMEALGQATQRKQDSLPQNRLPPPVVPPPVPSKVQLPPKPPVRDFRDRIKQAEERLRQSNPSPTTASAFHTADDAAQDRFTQFSSFDRETPKKKRVPLSSGTPVAWSKRRLSQDLRDPLSLRRAIVINEVLQPPMALRP